MKWIQFGEIDYKIIIPLIYPLLYQIRDLFHKDDSKAIFRFFTNFCGCLFSGIIYLIVRYRSKRLTKYIDETNDDLIYNINDNPENELSKQTKIITTNIYGENQIILEKNKLEKIKIKGQYLFILILVSIYLIPMFVDSFIALDSKLNFGTSSSLSLFLCIFFNISFSKIILGTKIYSHQIFASIIIILCIFIVFILFYVETSFSDVILLNIFLIILTTCLFALFNVLEKKYFDKYMDSPYHLLFIIGLFTSILILIYEFITVIIWGIDQSFNGILYEFKKYYDKYKFLYILFFIGDVITAFIWVSGIQLTVYFFTPCHFIISESLSQIVYTIINETIKDFLVYEKVLIYILFSVIIFSTLIYNEIFIINVCNLNQNTKNMILLRQNTDTESIFKQNTMDTFVDDESNKLCE